MRFEFGASPSCRTDGSLMTLKATPVASAYGSTDVGRSPPTRERPRWSNRSPSCALRTLPRSPGLVSAEEVDVGAEEVDVGAEEVDEGAEEERL